MLSDVGVDICKWLTIAGLEAQARRGGPRREEQEVLPHARRPSTAPARTLETPMPKHLPPAELNQTLVFQNRVLLSRFEARSELNQADKN